jgi:NitT/TauT family transport system substrate-binding protein
MIARRDRGIAKPSDLVGKRLGTAFGTNGEFVQDTIISMNKIDPQSIVRVDLAPAQAGDALVAGEVDAVTIWPPHSLEIKKRLGESAAVFSAKAIYSTTYDLVARDGMLKEHPQALRTLLAALLRADAFARADPARAVSAVAQALGLEEALVKDAVNAPALTVALNHSLIISMEDQARWAIKRGLVEAAAVPNFLEWIHADALAAVKPEAVSLIK